MAADPDKKLSFSYSNRRGGAVLEVLAAGCGECSSEDVDA